MNRSVCGADWQSAVSRVANPLVAPIHSYARRLPIGETADYQSALLDGHRSWSQCAPKMASSLPMNCAVVGQPSWLPVLRASLPAEHLGGRDAARTGRLEACATRRLKSMSQT